ncbi:MAG: helix-turn-helix transcriptional regulator [Candidatus Eremiobacteraeota bacterium]|nr:helix-turn-helix transcriptional regulator [Candidatus Eremiobacteraeota bacterium]MCW5870415.1 helix-turn-helix transcriptional regulator [Candidatus Eremiobacteraeota bacterium]
MDKIQGEQIRKARRKQGLSQEQLAEQLGVERLQVNRWETGKQQPRSEVLLRLAQALERPIEWFFEKPRQEHLDLAARITALDEKLNRVLQILESSAEALLTQQLQARNTHERAQ